MFDFELPGVRGRPLFTTSAPEQAHRNTVALLHHCDNLHATAASDRRLTQIIVLIAANLCNSTRSRPSDGPRQAQMIKKLFL